ncbi:MATE family efflux transporter, partial [Staphylococcus aureus]
TKNAVFTIGQHKVGLFTTDQANVEIATFILKVTMASLLLNVIGFLFTGMLQATGQVRGATIMAFLQGAII